MTDKSIIFSAPMVRALIEGRKFQTRRILKLAGRLPDYVGGRGFTHDPTCWGWEDSNNGDYVTIEKEPGQRMGWRDWRGAYRAGDRLWVKETHARYPEGDLCLPHYMADGPIPSISDRHDAGLLIKYPSIFCPRWASRLTLTVTDVRVQRLNDISDADARAEGCLRNPGPTEYGDHFSAEVVPESFGDQGWDCACDWFADLWNSIHGPDAWDKNPWIIALTFDVHRGNIDEVQP